MKPLPNIPSLASSVDSNIRRAFQALEGWTREINADGGMVTVADMVKSGLFDKRLSLHIEKPLDNDIRIPTPTSVVVQEELYATNVMSILKSRAIVSWDAMGARATGYALKLYMMEDITNNAILIASANTELNRWSFEDLAPGRYLVEVKTLSVLNLSSQWSVEVFELTGKQAPPSPPASVTAVVDKGFIRISIMPSRDLDIAAYMIRQGSSWGSGADIGEISFPQNVFLWQPDISGNLQFHVLSRDTSGLDSSIAASSNVITVQLPEFQLGVVLTSQVIDNNVLLSWPEASGTYPIDVYEIRRGSSDSFSANELIGQVRGTFTPIFEKAGGTFKYWVAAKDTAGLYSSKPISIYSTVNQPPDFVLRDSRPLLYSAATMTNCMVDTSTGYLVAPVNTADSWQQHFTGNSWATPQAQVDAGKEIFIQPGTPTGSYSEIIDYGTTVKGSKITLDLTRTTVAGTVTITPKISYKLNVGDAWTDNNNVYQIYATNFRYVKIELAFASADSGVMQITNSAVKLDVKMKTIEGMVTCAAADAGGTTVYITDTGAAGGNAIFTDVTSITVSAKGTTLRTPIYDFTDIPYPEHFHVYLFDSAGARLSGDVSWLVRGV